MFFLGSTLYYGENRQHNVQTSHSPIHIHKHTHSQLYIRTHMHTYTHVCRKHQSMPKFHRAPISGLSPNKRELHFTTIVPHDSSSVNPSLVQLALIECNEKVKMSLFNHVIYLSNTHFTCFSCNPRKLIRGLFFVID